MGNVIEISRNTEKSADQIQSFLSEIGEQWFPMDMNPLRVIEREKQYLSGNENPCFDAGFAKAYYPYIHDGRLSLSTVVDLSQDGQEKPEPESIQALTTEICQFVQTGRDQWRLNQESVFNAFPNLPFDPDRPAQFTYNRLMQLVFKESFKFEVNDALDFCHATVSLAYGDFVLLDKHWTNLAGKLGMSSNHVRVYSKPQIDQFFHDLEQFQVCDKAS